MNISIKKITIFLVCLSLALFGCSEHDHDHENGPHDPGSHLHAEEPADEEHSHDEENKHDHLEDSEENHNHEEDIEISDNNWEKLVDLQTEKVRVESIELTKQLPARIIADPNKKALISTFIEASINDIEANIGDTIRKGEMLACVTSPQIGLLRAEFDKAKAKLKIAEDHFDRAEKLYKEDVISRKKYLAVQLEKDEALVDYNYAHKKLLAIGLKESELQEAPVGHSSAVGSTIHLYAPLSGIVTKREASLGQKVSSSDMLFEITDLSNVWVEADLFVSDLNIVDSKQKVFASVNAYPERVFEGKVVNIGNTVNDKTKTVKIHVEIENEDLALKPGMFANLSITIGNKENTIVVSKNAVLDDEGQKIVFVMEGKDYHKHVVTTGIENHDKIEIISGLKENDLVVVEGNFQLKSKLKMQNIDPHAGHNH